MKSVKINYDKISGIIKRKLEIENQPNITLCEHDCYNCTLCIYDVLAKIFVDITFDVCEKAWGVKNEK